MRALKLFVFIAIISVLYITGKNLINFMESDNRKMIVLSSLSVENKSVALEHKKITSLWINKDDCKYQWDIEHYFDRGVKNLDLILYLNRNKSCNDLNQDEIQLAIMNKILRLWNSRNLSFLYIKNENNPDIHLLNKFLKILNIKASDKLNENNSAKYQLEELELSN